MKAKPDNRHWISDKETKSRELVYELIKRNKEIDAKGTTIRVGEKVYFVRELG